MVREKKKKKEIIFIRVKKYTKRETDRETAYVLKVNIRKFTQRNTIKIKMTEKLNKL